MSFLVSLLLPVLATVLYFRGYVERASQGRAPTGVSTRTALVAGALSGASALIFLGLLGVVILVYRGRTLTPAGMDSSAAVFWLIQFVLTAAIGAAVGALTAAAMLPWLRARLARLAPAASA